MQTLLTSCASCAAPLGLSSGKKCGRCSTRYCGPACQKKHWEEGGHDKLCKKIKRSGGAEQYNANKKYAEAVAVAAEECAEDTKGQTCYICTQALHWRTKERLVRGCSCRGTAGFAHVSCLAEQAKILLDEVEENNLGHDALDERWTRWHTCGLCEQEYHGVVRCALGWACWNTYVGRPEGDWTRTNAITLLGLGLNAAQRHEDALTVREAELSMLRRVGAPEENVLVAQSNLADTYQELDRKGQAARIRREVYSGFVKQLGEEHKSTLIAALNYVSSLNDLKRCEEAKSLMSRTMRVARRVLGESNEVTLKMRWVCARALSEDPAATLDDVRESVTTLEELARTARRVLGSAHPTTEGIEDELQDAREELCAREGDVESVRNAVEAMTPG
jgi:hypothetical protein